MEQFQEKSNNFSSVEKILYYRRKIHHNSTSCLILQTLYPDKEMTLKKITSCIGKPYQYAKKTILNMCCNNYLMHNSVQYNRKYCLTKTGRWFAICSQLNISFQSLCLLAAVYDTTKHHPDGPEKGYYMMSSFRRLFDSTFDENASAVYTKRNIFKSAKTLLNHHLMYSPFCDILKIESCVFEMLQKKYDVELEELSKWNHNVSEKCKERLLYNIELGKNLQLLGMVAAR